MKKRLVISITLLIFLTTITFQQKIVISKFNLKKIQIENNFFVLEKDIQKLLSQFLNKNIIFLKNSEIEKALLTNSFIESFDIKKKYPDTLKVRIYEKKPIAILINKKKKYYISETIKLVEYISLTNFKNLPYVLGNEKEFKILYDNLNKINFPFDQIKKFTLYETNRWDLETKSDILIKLPPDDYIKSLENFLSIRNKKNIKKYKVFDYRISNQIILK
tara:strand:- start:1257 stop:1913 length:657 start_codon:yes stop_codon:yes gene_type:complete